MDAIMAARAEMKGPAAELGLPKFTLMPLLMKVSVQYSVQYPTLRCYDPMPYMALLIELAIAHATTPARHWLGC